MKMTDEEIDKCVGELVRVETLEELAALPSDTNAVLVSRPDDAKLKVLARLPKLTRLIQDGNSYVSDDGLKILGGMSALEELDLEWSDLITDAGLVHLHSLANLMWLDIGFCRGITECGVNQLRESLPSCEIIA